MRSKTMKPNILFIVIDSLRARNLSCYGYIRHTSPHLDSLSRQGVLFKDAYSCTNATDPSLTTIFSGKFCRSHGVLHHGSQVQDGEIRDLVGTTRLLPEILQQHGYRTLAIDWLGRWHRRGYDYYSGILESSALWGLKRLKYGQTREDSQEVKNRLVSFAIAKLRDIIRRGKPRPRTDVFGNASIVTDKTLEIIEKNMHHSFFLFVHYWDVHFPYNCPDRYQTMHYEPDRELERHLEDDYIKWRKDHIKALGGINRAIALYDGAISYVDDELGKLFQALNEWGILDDTFVIVTADHGESLTEHKIYFDHHGLYRETLHVPLILKGPGLPVGRTVGGFVQHADLTPTILDILDIKAENVFDGRSLLPSINEQRELRSAIYAEEAHAEEKQMIATAKYKYIVASSEKDALCQLCGKIHGGIEELYDLKKDPQESNNIVKEYPDKAQLLKGCLLEWIKSKERKRERALLKRKIRLLKQRS